MHKLFKAVSPLTLTLGLLMVCGVARADKFTVSIQVNTAATNDDLVQLGGDTPCEIWATGAPDNDFTVTLSNPDARLTLNTATISVPKDGTHKPFSIHGKIGSVNKNDAVIKAMKANINGTQIEEGSASASVFYFDPPSMNVTQGGSYAIIGDVYKPTGVAVSLSASWKLEPTGLDCNAPQLQDTDVGILQNTLLSVRTKTWSNPSIVWTANATKGDTVTVELQHEATINPAGLPVVDTIPTTTTPPCYPTPVAICDSPSNSNDGPTTPAPATHTMDMKNAAGVKIGVVTWSHLDRVTMSLHFGDWCVRYTPSTKAVQPLREAGWYLNVDSTQANQVADPIGDKAVTSTNIQTSATGPFSNDLYKLPASYSEGKVGTAETTFTFTPPPATP